MKNNEKIFFIVFMEGFYGFLYIYLKCTYLAVVPFFKPERLLLLGSDNLLGRGSRRFG